MTIEEKVREIVRTAVDNSLSVDRTTQAILALIKPMSRERLIEIIFNQIGGELAEQELLRQIRLSGRTVTEIEGYRGLIKGKAVLLADAILAEWEKGLK